MGRWPHGDGSSRDRHPRFLWTHRSPFICFCFCVCPPEAPTPSLLTDLRKQPARVERLSPLDLDQVAHVIADAVHGVGASGPWEGNAGESAGSLDERPPEDGDQGGDGLRGECLPNVGGWMWPQSWGNAGFSRWDASFLPGDGICVNDFYLFELLPVKAFLPG